MHIDVRRLGVAALIVCLLRPGAHADSGSYVTSVAIDVPSFHGIAPRVGLTYDSQGGNSPVGTGWALQASSAIERASPGRGVPRYDDSKDIFFFDGVELIACAGSGSPSPSCLPAVGGTYFSKVENFLRILHDPTNSTWTVWSKDGTESAYVQERQVLGVIALDWTRTRRWVLSSVTDTHGNRVDYHYTDGARPTTQAPDLFSDIYLDRITYATGIACEASPPCEPAPCRECPEPYQRGAVLPGAEIKFFWEERPDPLSFGIGPGLAETAKRLKSIRVMNAGQRIGVYVLQHLESASSKRSLVSAMKQYRQRRRRLREPRRLLRHAFRRRPPLKRRQRASPL